MRIPALATALVLAPVIVWSMSELPADPPRDAMPPVAEEDSGMECDADAFAYLIGEPRETVEALDIPQPVRIIPEGAMVTMDFRPERINFDLNAEGRVIRVRCG